MKLSNDSSQKKKRKPDTIKENLAKSSTLYSDTPISLRVEIRKPIEALAAYYLSLWFQPWQTDVLVRSIAYRAYSNCYQGKWEQVQQILELELHDPESFEKWYCKHNPSEFFGNILPMAEIIEKRVRYKDLRIPDQKTIRKPIRRRGYKDKGSRRLSHEHHGIPPISEERLDRRQKVSHPLLKETEEVLKLNPDRGCVAWNIRTEGGENNGQSYQD